MGKRLGYWGQESPVLLSHLAPFSPSNAMSATVKSATSIPQLSSQWFVDSYLSEDFSPHHDLASASLPFEPSWSAASCSLLSRSFLPSVRRITSRDAKSCQQILHRNTWSLWIDVSSIWETPDTWECAQGVWADDSRAGPFLSEGLNNNIKDQVEPSEIDVNDYGQVKSKAIKLQGSGDWNKICYKTPRLSHRQPPDVQWRGHWLRCITWNIILSTVTELQRQNSISFSTCRRRLTVSSLNLTPPTSSFRILVPSMVLRSTHTLSGNKRCLQSCGQTAMDRLGNDAQQAWCIFSILGSPASCWPGKTVDQCDFKPYMHLLDYLRLHHPAYRFITVNEAIWKVFAWMAMCWVTLRRSI